MNIDEVIDNLTEADAQRLFWAMRDKFGWAGTYQCMGDVQVRIEAPERYVHLDWDDGDEDDLTPAMREAVQDTYVWDRAIADRMAEIGNELTPTVTIYLDGTFGVMTADDNEERRFNADGKRID